MVRMNAFSVEVSSIFNRKERNESQRIRKGDSEITLRILCEPPRTLRLKLSYPYRKEFSIVK